MNDRIDGLSQIAATSARRLAASQAIAVQRYAEVLARYGRGELGSGSFGSAVINLAMREGARYSEDVVRTGAEYVKAALAVVGVDLRRVLAPQAGRAEQSAKRGAPGDERDEARVATTRRSSRTKKARAATAGHG